MKKDGNILITGATGLVGSYLARLLLKEGYTRVFGLKRTSSGTELLGDDAQRISWIEADLATCNWYEVLEQVEYVFHCAALISHCQSRQGKDVSYQCRRHSKPL